MEIEIIKNSGLTSKDFKSIKLVKIHGVNHYYLVLVNKGGRCKRCGLYVYKSKELRNKLIIHDKDVIIHYKARRFVCDCGCTFYETNPFTEEKSKLSKYLIKNILLDLKRYNHTFLEVAQKYKISVTKVIEIFDTHVQIPLKPLREVISIDEFYFSRKSSSKYAFMILGLNGEILDILKSRKKHKLLDYFKYKPISERDRVKYVTMDMNEVYKEVINRRLKNATICIDSFHVMSHINNALDIVRLKTLNSFSENKRSDEYYLLKHKKYVLFKNDLKEDLEYNRHFRLEMNDRDYLNIILKIDPVLTKAYYLMKHYYYFNHYWSDFTRQEAFEMIKDYIDECYKSEIPSFIEVANTLNNRKEEIANSFIAYTNRKEEVIRLSNGKIEGKNSYIKKMIRLANGYSNFERFRNRAMYAENIFDTYSEEKLPNIIKRIYKKKVD